MNDHRSKTLIFFLTVIVLFFVGCDNQRKAGDGEVESEDQNFEEQQQELTNVIREEIVSIDNAIDQYQSNLHGMGENLQEKYSEVINQLQEQEKNLQELLKTVINANQDEWQETRNEVRKHIEDVKVNVTNLKEEIKQELES